MVSAFLAASFLLFTDISVRSLRLGESPKRSLCIAPASTLSSVFTSKPLIACRVIVHPDCINLFNDLKVGKSGKKYIIYRISDDVKEIVVDEVGQEAEYDVFREKLQDAKDKDGKSRPSYAVYDLAFDLGGVEGSRFGRTLRF